MKRSRNQIRQPRPNAVDEIKTFDNDDKATKHFETKNFFDLVIIVKNLISSIA